MVRVRKTPSTPSTAPMIATTPTERLRRQILEDMALLKLPLTEGALDAQLTRVAQEGTSPMEFLARMIGDQANRRRESGIARRIREAKFAEDCTLEGFDWDFNAKTIPRQEIEPLLQCDFLRRRESLILVGQSGLGKSRIIQAIGRAACVLGYRTRYVTSGGLIAELTAAMADNTLAKRVKYYARFDFLIIDEFAFDRAERLQSRCAANLLYNVVNARTSSRSTAVVTNIEIRQWDTYIRDLALCGAIRDRVVDRARIHTLTGKSYRLHRAEQLNSPKRNSGGDSNS